MFAFQNVSNSNFKIYCGAEQKTMTWSRVWNANYDDKWPVQWGVTREEYNSKG